MGISQKERLSVAVFVLSDQGDYQGKLWDGQAHLFGRQGGGAGACGVWSFVQDRHLAVSAGKFDYAHAWHNHSCSGGRQVYRALSRQVAGGGNWFIGLCKTVRENWGIGGRTAMNSGNMVLESAFDIVMTILPVLLAVMVFICLIRAIKGPRVADRIVAINMMGTMTMVIIAILSVKMNEGYLVDICIIYAMISFLAVTLLTKVYMGVYAERQKKKEESAHDRTTVD